MGGKRGKRGKRAGTEAGADGGGGSQTGSQTGTPSRSWTGDLDLWACVALVGLACLAATTLPDGSVLRLAIALLALLVAPGYLLIEAAAGPARSAAARLRRSALAIGASPGLFGLVALATAGLPGGFRPASIVLLVGVTCLGLAGAALWRRRMHVRQAVAQPVPA